MSKDYTKAELDELARIQRHPEWQQLLARMTIREHARRLLSQARGEEPTTHTLGLEARATLAEHARKQLAETERPRLRPPRFKKNEQRWNERYEKHPEDFQTLHVKNNVEINRYRKKLQRIGLDLISASGARDLGYHVPEDAKGYKRLTPRSPEWPDRHLSLNT